MGRVVNYDICLGLPLPQFRSILAITCLIRV
jgi:hypothetical protein